MDVLPNLEDAYNLVRNESISYLVNTYGAIEVDLEDKYKYPVTLRVNITVADFEISLLISLPFDFPDSFPIIKLDDLSFQKLYPLPHLNKSKILCLFDDVLASPNPENPLGILESTIEKAKKVLLDGILNNNNEEYREEFNTYWAEDSIEFYLSIVKPSKTPKEVYMVPFKYNNWKEKGIISDQRREAFYWIKNVGGSFKEEEIKKILYIPLDEPIHYPFPETNFDIYKLLVRNTIALKSLTNFLTKYKRPTMVLFSMKIDNEYTWAMWEHQSPKKSIISRYKGKKRKETNLKGFRKGIQHGYLELVKEFPKRKIAKYSITDVRKTRLKIRGGDGKVEFLDSKVAIIGCGALGSHIAQSIFELGIQNLLLVDYDILSFENINRHLCGANYIGQKKTAAVKNLLEMHYPTSFINIYNDDVISLLRVSPHILNSYDLIIVAISQTPTELRLNELQERSLINKPILNVWVEPYLAGSHAVWTNPNNYFSLKNLFNNGLYKYQVLRNGNLFSKKELGCNTSYVPYGVLELKKFVIDLMTFIQQQLNSEYSKAYTWLGNLEEQRRNNRLLSPKWIAANNYTHRQYDLIQKNQESAD
jgi:hypothetical protein